MNNTDTLVSVVFMFMSIYYLFLLFRIEKGISVMKHIEKKLDSIRPEVKHDC